MDIRPGFCTRPRQRTWKVNDASSVIRVFDVEPSENQFPRPDRFVAAALRAAIG
jgi:hypothetical protein